MNPAADPPAADELWDAGAMGCGELVIELRERLLAKPTGFVLHLVAQDPGAIEDLPSFCRLTRHSLLAARHPDYWIRRRDS